MTGGGPGIEARPSLSAARAYARVHRLQYFCRRCVRASRVEGRLRRVFQAELNHFRGSPAAQLRDQGQHEIDASRHAAPGQDVAVPYDATIVDDGTPHAEVESAIRDAAGALLESVQLFDVYRGDPIPVGRKSLAFSLRYREADRTLGDDEVSATHGRVEAALAARFGAEVRGR